MGKSFNQLWLKDLSLFSSLFFVKPKDLPGIKMFFIKVSLSALPTFLRKQNVQMSFLLPNNFFMSSEAIGKLIAGGLFVKVIQLSRFELTLLPVFYWNESNSENVSCQLCELVSTLPDEKQKKIS